MTPWILPETVEIGGIEYEINTDFRDVLEIIGYLTDPDESEYVRWRIAIALFYIGDIPQEHQYEAMQYLTNIF